MGAPASRLLSAWGIDHRAFRSLARSFLLMDLRGQHYSRATATQPRHIMTPLFWVVGQCLTFSAAASLLLFARVDVRFFAFAGLAGSMLVMATAILVEFNEVALDPRDLEVIGHRPVSPRTYAAARFANLLFYFGLLHAALTIFPLIVGAGLRDAGPLYAPAYLLASLAGDMAVAAAVILALSVGGTSGRLEGAKEVLAWTQIVLILVVGYGGQLFLRDDGHRLELWAAFPPDWVRLLPPDWLAAFVDAASFRPGRGCLLAALVLVAVTVGSGLAIYLRLAGFYRAMSAPAGSPRERPMPAAEVGALRCRPLAGIARSREERIGYWAFRTFLGRDAALRMHCLLPLNLPLAVVVLGLATGQFADPLTGSSPRLTALPALAVYLIALGVPSIVHNLCFSEDGEASWIFVSAPLARPEEVARGACKAAIAVILAPACLIFGLTAAFAWGHPLSAALHAALALALSWPAAVASVRSIAPGLPFSLPRARGSALTPAALPLAAFWSIGLLLAGLHALLASSPWFWFAAALAGIAAFWYVRRPAGVGERAPRRSGG